MGGASSKPASESISSPALSRASPPPSGPWSPSPWPTALWAMLTRGRSIGAAALTSIPPGEAAGQRNKRRGSPPDDVGDTVGRDGKRMKGVGSGGVSGSIIPYDVGQLQRPNEERETQSLLFSCHPTGAASGKMLDPSRSRQNVQQISSFKLDPAKHKIFLSHSGVQKDFVEQLCVDLEARGYLFPFFDQRHHSLPKGKDFVPLIKEAAQLCHVAVIVLSKEFLCSKWPMIELAEFHAAQQGGNQHLNMLPLFYKLSIDDLDDQSIEDCWMPTWIRHASDDKRIDVTKWSAAVRALRQVNGLIFCKNAMSKVAYRRDVVQCILKLSLPDLLNESSRNVVGYHRMCQAVSGQFVKDTRIGAQVLGLYGMSGLGKSTLSKALCDYFYEKFSGRVFHMELGEVSKMKRLKLMLKMLCGFEEDLLCRIAEVGQGLKQMREHMEREPVFLAIDNVTNDERSWKEALTYLMVGFHPESRILITSRSRVILQDLLPDVRFCMPMPSLSEWEAGAIFLSSAAPMKSISLLTNEERTVLGLCIQHCLFESSEDESLRRRKRYHPLALSALGDFFYRLSNNQMLLWKDHVEKNEDLLKEVWKSPSISSIIGLQFNTLHPSEQLLFLDISLYIRHWGSIFSTFVIQYLSALHGETPTVMRRRLRDLKRSGMFNWVEGEGDLYVHDLYNEFAKWYVTEHDVKGMKNAWGVFQAGGTSMRCDAPASKCWSDLVRLRIFDLTLANARFVASKAMQELHNLVLLQLHSCTHLTVLNLQGLDCLRHLELDGLTKLVTVTLTGNSSTDEHVGIYDSLLIVVLEDLDSLRRVPDFRSCTALQWVTIRRCYEVENWEGIECPRLKYLKLLELAPHQSGRLPNFKSLHALVRLVISFVRGVARCTASWELRTDAMEEDSRYTYSWSSLEDSFICHRLVEGVVLYMRQWNRLRLVYWYPF